MTSKTPRQAKTPRQRAEEALGLATRKHDRAHDEVKRLRAALNGAETRLTEAAERRQYAADDPALKNTRTTPPSPSTGGTTA